MGVFTRGLRGQGGVAAVRRKCVVKWGEKPRCPDNRGSELGAGEGSGTSSKA